MMDGWIDGQMDIPPFSILIIKGKESVKIVKLQIGKIILARAGYGCKRK